MAKHTSVGSLAVAILVAFSGSLGADLEVATEADNMASLLTDADADAGDVAGASCGDVSKLGEELKGWNSLEILGIGDIVETVPCSDGDEVCTFKCQLAAARCEVSCSGCPYYHDCWCESPHCVVHSFCTCFYPCNP